MSKSEEHNPADDSNKAGVEAVADSADISSEQGAENEAVDVNVINKDASQDSDIPTIEADSAEEGETDNQYQSELEKAALLLEDARAKADNHWDQVLRLQAENENLRRRHERELEKAHKYGTDKLAEELLPALDSLELGLMATVDQDAGIEKLIEGTELTLKMFKAALQKFGIKELNPVSEAFNPELHQAMTMQESDKVSPNTVLQVYQKGYQIHDRLLRPARVVVAKAAQGAGDSEESASDSAKTPDIAGSEDSAEQIGSQIDEKA